MQSGVDGSCSLPPAGGTADEVTPGPTSVGFSPGIGLYFLCVQGELRQLSDPTMPHGENGLGWVVVKWA